MEQISDQEWFEANLNPQLYRETYRARLGFGLPDIPTDEIQWRFAGRSGRENLQQAFDFYKFVLGKLPQGGTGKYDLLDFGAGWGRILRLFLREFKPERLVLVDCLSDAVEQARSLNYPFKIIHSRVDPPLPLEKGSIGAAYAFSVFSHLSESACYNWLRHFADLLVPGGKLIISTRGEAHINYLDSLTRANSPNQLLEFLPAPELIRSEYEKGVFQFYPMGGGGELSEEFYGESWIPRQWLEERHLSLGFSACEFQREFEAVDQCVFVLTK